MSKEFKCPKCGEETDALGICRVCGYPEKDTFSFILGGVLAIIAFGIFSIACLLGRLF